MGAGGDAAAAAEGPIKGAGRGREVRFARRAGDVGVSARVRRDSRSSVNSRAPQEGRVDERIDSKFAGGIDTGAAEAHRSGVSQNKAAVDWASGLVAERCAVHQVP